MPGTLPLSAFHPQHDTSRPSASPGSAGPSGATALAPLPQGGPPVGIGERLELGCAALGISLRELGVRARLPPKRIYLIRTDRSPIGAWAEAIAAVLGCDARWLRTGEGDAPAWGVDRTRALLKRSASAPAWRPVGAR